MQLYTPTYHSPSPTEGTFTEVFIEEVSFERKRIDKHLTIRFEMYYFRGEEKIVISNSHISFVGMNADSANTNRTTILSIPNVDYDAQVAAIDVEAEDYEALVAAVPTRVNVPMLEYLSTHEGVLPEGYEVVDWGFPSYEDVLQYFEGGSLAEPELFVTQPFARQWFLNNIYMKGEKVGTQFTFI